MSFLNDEIDDQRAAKGGTRQGLWHAKIATTATDLSDKLFVTIPRFGDELRYGPARWQARSDTALPTRGNDCWVQWDDRGELIIVVWWSFS